MVILFNATFNNISVISWRSVLLMDETKAPRETHSSAASHCQTLFFRVVSSTSRHGNIHMEVLLRITKKNPTHVKSGIKYHNPSPLIHILKDFNSVNY
jgi:hypothetical protein